MKGGDISNLFTKCRTIFMKLTPPFLFELFTSVRLVMMPKNSKCLWNIEGVTLEILCCEGTMNKRQCLQQVSGRVAFFVVRRSEHKEKFQRVLLSPRNDGNFEFFPFALSASRFTTSPNPLSPPPTSSFL
jgi:hypothetical protein